MHKFDYLTYVYTIETCLHLYLVIRLEAITKHLEQHMLKLVEILLIKFSISIMQSKWGETSDQKI